jgi:hypothetical protein
LALVFAHRVFIVIPTEAKRSGGIRFSSDAAWVEMKMQGFLGPLRPLGMTP